MESSKDKRVDKRGYELVEGADADNLSPSKKQKLPGLARYIAKQFVLLICSKDVCNLVSMKKMKGIVILIETYSFIKWVLSYSVCLHCHY